MFVTCLATLPAKSEAQPFLTQDQNPFSLVHGLPQAVSAQLPEANTAQWSLTLDVTNTLNSESSSTETLFMDFESYNLRFTWLHGLNKNWALKVDIPLIYYGGGFLDNSIDNWHEFFHFPRADRPNVTNDQFQILYELNAQTLINFNASQSSLADAQIALGRTIFNQQDSALSLWISADLPTGDPANLSGNDSIDLSLWLAGEYHYKPKWSVDANLGILLPGENQPYSMAIEDQVFFAYAGIEWQAHKIFDIRMQLNAHSQFYSNSQLLLLGPSYNLVFGGRIHVNKCSDIDLAFSEDIQVGTTPDISFLLSWKSNIDCQ